jgi:hypothetical protein
MSVRGRQVERLAHDEVGQEPRGGETLLAPAPPSVRDCDGVLARAAPLATAPLASPRQCPLEPGACLAGEGRDVDDHEHDFGEDAAVCRKRWLGARGGPRVPFNADLAATLRLTTS